MSSPEPLAQRMRLDWNARALEDARYFIAFGRRQQDDVEFASTATDVLTRVGWEFARLPAHLPLRARRFLEIGCGIGRLVQPLSECCGEIHGVDISDEMVRLGRQRLASIPNAHLHWTPHSDLAAFADSSFHFIYSYAVMQHLPDEAPFWTYLSESARVLKRGGVLVQQFNSAPRSPDVPADTWAGIAVRIDRLLAACSREGLHVLALEGAGTQYTWLTATPRQGPASGPRPARLFDISQAHGVAGAERLTAGGPSGFAEIYVAHLAQEYCDLCGLAGQLADVALSVVRTGCLQADGQRQITLQVPACVPAGEHAISLTWHGAPLTQPFPVVVQTFTRAAPQLLRVTDGLDLLNIGQIVCGIAKVWIRNLTDGAELQARIGGAGLTLLDSSCEDAIDQRFQVNLRLPEGLPRGPHVLEVALGDGIVLSAHIENCPAAS